MKKTKEIDVWVPIKELQGDNFGEVDNSYAMYTRDRGENGRGEPLAPAKLIIELPERKVEITESQFDELAQDFERHKSCQYLKEKLFGGMRRSKSSSSL